MIVLVVGVSDFGLLVLKSNFKVECYGSILGFVEMTKAVY